jgi:hypothetical protein
MREYSLTQPPLFQRNCWISVALSDGTWFTLPADALGADYAHFLNALKVLDHMIVRLSELPVNRSSVVTGDLVHNTRDTMLPAAFVICLFSKFFAMFFFVVFHFLLEFALPFRL